VLGLRTMRATPYIAGIFWAAIVLIAVQLAPSVALAHAGHSHDKGVVAAVEPPTPLDQAGSVQSGIPHDQELRNADHVASGRIDAAGTCAGACCGNGMACCGAVLVTDQLGSPLPSLRSVRAMAPNAPDASGIEPQAPPKPPRSVA
jgi:hypothetical protein